MAAKKRKKKYKNPYVQFIVLTYNRIIALFTLLNLGLVLFDLSYIPWRSFYFYHLPRLTELYDPIKGIEPHREIEKYLQAFEQLKANLAETGLQSPQTAKDLQTLRELSTQMIRENPFQLANKTGTLEQIKNRMRNRVGNDSATQSFNIFWSESYLSQAGALGEIRFFDDKIRPLIASNYFRTLGEDGNFTDNFWRIDRWFILIFAIDIAGHTLLIYRRFKSLSLLDAFLWRWYDIFLVLPIWRWLRLISVTIRLHESDLIDLEPVRAQFSRGFVATIGNELTEAIVVQVISQLQTVIEEGDVVRDFFQRASREYISVNDVNEVEEIGKRLVQITTCQVLPQVRPDLEAWMKHNVTMTLQRLPLYQQLGYLPGVNNISSQLAEQVAAQLTLWITEGPQSAYQTVTSLPDDPKGSELFERLMRSVGKQFGVSIQEKQMFADLRILMRDFLEEFKLNYVQNLAEADFDRLLEESSQIQKNKLNQE
ncbi:hypothetical protein [Trichothermofontia sp.]